MANAELPESAARIIGRVFFGTTSAAGFACSVILALLPVGLSSGGQMLLVGGVLVFAALCALAARASGTPQFPMDLALCSVAVVTMLLAATVAVALNEGVRSPALGFTPLIVCVVGAITRPRVSLLLGGAAMVLAAMLAWLEVSGLLPPSTALMPSLAAAKPSPVVMVLLFQWLVILCSAVGGGVIARVLAHYLHAAEAREARFRGLLRIAADWYWEQDTQFRFTHVSEPTTTGAKHAPRKHWQLTEMGLSDEQLDAHRAQLEAHRPFSGLLAQLRDSSGHWRSVSLSGEPQFDKHGAFTGYWGVARDVTDEARAQRAVAASETRYRELFTRSPSPLFLHRRGIVFDANEAAARMCGFANAAAMNGFNIGQLFPAGPQRERMLERTARLERMRVGEGLPVSDFAIRAVDGRPLSVQATGVRVDTSSGPANLSIFYDVTARQAAESALRRSEAMLSHLFATSPDCIALTEMASGRYAMVNPAFCRLTGFDAEEVVGRTAAELGLWHDQRTVDHLLKVLERDGTVVDVPAVFVAKSGELVAMRLAAGRFVMDQRDYLVVNAHDVTESERTRLQHIAILEHASIGIAFTRNSTFVEANPYFERMFGWPAGSLRGQPGSVVWPSSEDHAEIGDLASPLLSTGHPFEIERRMRRRDGSDFRCRLLAQAVNSADPSRGGTIWIAEDVTERRRLDDALAAARDAAEAASQAKSAFLANTSHEIRTPLNGLLGLARLAMREDLTDDRRQAYLNQILDSAQSLAGIMSDILDVSKIEAGRLALEDTPFDLHDALRAVHHAYDSLAQGKGLSLQLVLDDQLPTTVRGDPVRVRQILSNFITNALKFTERGQVRIEAAPTLGGGVRLAVTDTGPGVPEDMQERLFTPFSQGDTSTTRRFGGTGLGLSICRELAQLMGGFVGVDSVLGQGSTFWAELPLPGSAPAAAELSTEVGDLERLFRARVLMVEDNPVNMMISVAMLEHWGVRVAQASDGRMAIQAVHEAVHAGDPFDVVVMDVQMPVMSGHEAARELRAHYSPRVLPIIALTAAALVSERDEAIACGMDDFLTKPVDAPTLRASLARHVRTRRQRA
ncbi:MAG: PAS domain S-box protein [Burkholderiales bacterium]